jgi:hypothetical protein
VDDDRDAMLSTVDNPWDPFDAYDEWYAFDRAKGYDTPSLLARIADVNYDLPDANVKSSIRQAMDEIVELNVSGMHVLIHRPAERQLKN